MDSNIFKLVYCSRNCIHGSDAQVVAELQKILASARKNNPSMGITGALLYNAGHFAQVLEGPIGAVERQFEIIKRDPRHSEVMVVHCGLDTERLFPDWSMAFVGSRSDQGMPQATAAFESVFASATGAGEEMLLALKELAVREDDWALFETVV